MDTIDPWLIYVANNNSCSECQENHGKRFRTNAFDRPALPIHPNCKCTLSLLWDSSQIERIAPDYMQEQENYQIRQKVNGISLTRNKLEVDLELARKLGNEGMVDKISKKLWKLSEQEQKLINKLPTESLRKQVVAINR
jgi:hypothetical protein